MAYRREHLEQLFITAFTRQTETTDVEFKDGRGGSIPNDFWRPVTAFSHNPDGGVIFFGISEKEGRITGGLNLAILQEQVASYFAEALINVAPPELHIIRPKIDGQTVVDILAVIVKPIPDEKKPCYSKAEGLSRGACIRVGTSNRVMSEDEIKRLIRATGPFRFDKTEVSGVTRKSLSTDKIVAFLQQSAERANRPAKIVPSNVTSELLTNVGILVEKKNPTDIEEYAPTVAGYLIFSTDNPMQKAEFSRYEIRCVRYKGSDPTSLIIDKADITGTLDEQIDQTLTFILRNIPLQATIKGAKRIDEYAYPQDAIREVVANAVIHRDYQMNETYTNVSIFDNRIEVTNPGSLPPGITIKNIKTSQFSRNGTMAQILRDLKYMEEFGRGIDLIYSGMRGMDLLEPIFRNTANSFQVVLLGPSFKGMNRRQMQLWKDLQQEDTEVERVTAAQYAKHFDISRGAANLDLATLVKSGLIKKTSEGTQVFYELGL